MTRDPNRPKRHPETDHFDKGGSVTSNGRFHCECPRPSRHPSPFHATSCVKCGGFLPSTWVSNDVLLDRFWTRLEEGMFPGNAEIPLWFETLKRKVFAREHEGRDLYDLAYLGRDNLSEADDEAADAIVYLYLDHLNAQRQGGDHDFGHVLDTASCAALYFGKNQDLKHFRRGAP